MEHQTTNLGAGGSNPSGRAKYGIVIPKEFYNFVARTLFGIDKK
jgi:hypothetical protein